MNLPIAVNFGAFHGRTSVVIIMRQNIGLLLVNGLLLFSVWQFSSGFLSSALFPNGLPESTIEDRENVLATPVFDRLIFVVIDALRSDFLFGHESGFNFTQSLIRSGAAVPFTAHASLTATMPCLKAITTGSIPGFYDVLGNLDQSEVSSFLTHDSWLSSLRAQGKQLVLYGDETWLRLFPNGASLPGIVGDFWLRAESVESFLTSDYIEVDQNVTQHVSAELRNTDWTAMILHYLGVDHIGHMLGPNAPQMISKQAELDCVIKTIFEVMSSQEEHEKTLLVVMGDHGMNAAGNHGGNDAGESESALIFASPKFRAYDKQSHDCPAAPNNNSEFDFYTKVDQKDVATTIASLMGVAIPRHSLGVFIEDLKFLWPDHKNTIQVLMQNARQMRRIIDATLRQEWLECTESDATATIDLELSKCGKTKQNLQHLTHLYSLMEGRCTEALGSGDWVAAENALTSFLQRAQWALSKSASSPNAARLKFGASLCALSVAIGSLLYSWQAWSWNTCIVMLTSFTTLVCSLGPASQRTGIEREFWEILTLVWFIILAIRTAKGARSHRAYSNAAVRILTIQLFLSLWNGQIPSVRQTFSVRYVGLMWTAVAVTYISAGYKIYRYSLVGALKSIPRATFAASLTFLAFHFKLNLSQQALDARSLRNGPDLADSLLPRGFELDYEAKAIFICVCLAPLILPILLRRARGLSNSPPANVNEACQDRFHHFLTTFLMTQTRAPNIPLFLCLEQERLALRRLLSSQVSKTNVSRSKAKQLQITNIAVSVFALSHTYYFWFGASHSISSVDLGNAFNGVSTYNFTAVAILLFAANWTGPIWWCSAAVTLLSTSQPETDVIQDQNDPTDQNAVESKNHVLIASNSDETWHEWIGFLLVMSTLMAGVTLAVMIACIVSLEEPSLWAQQGQRYLFALFWLLEWHLIVVLGVGSLLKHFAIFFLKASRRPFAT